MCATILKQENIFHEMIVRYVIDFVCTYTKRKFQFEDRAGILVNLKDENDNTLLMSVLRLDAMRIVRQLKMPDFDDTIKLLKKYHLRDVVVNARNAKDVIDTLLLYAKKGEVKDGHKAVIRALVVGENRILKIVELLLSHPNIKVDTKNNYGETPLMLAAANGNVRAVKSLLGYYPTKGKNVNEINNKGNTALVMAVMPEKCDTYYKTIHPYEEANERRFDLVKLLLGHPNIKDVDGKALCWARKLGYDAIETLLMNHNKKR